jgi:predicted amidohydrolase YtcJ
VTREGDAGQTGGPLGAGEAMALDRALRAQCLDGPLSAGEQDRGRLVPGHRGDVVVIPAAALTGPVSAGGPLATVRPRLVLLDGEVAFEA